ncbi:cytochrome bb' ubiquinol oxidase subunit II [Candidatus Hydrogenisulfobacillus filiaventi]|uniref:Cytochrome bb' ubiquinol oxidase subunit II n=1 Tax=Candidatus Hydrogenisulfobacillus filiaventi TaxID=2707344 RepID=A0A6F8ZGV3_9FIRM|nr:cytochrome d ubiquinol oxidase subunit II [Bacillota bacterium]CAB1128822.1 cytochrome bb' ubiquinol oxidase subunit II [Candidatus Hydrogenisulfobacillus filiaventi]
MPLADLWFLLLGVLFAGFFFLEGFDYGVGMLLPVAGRTDTDRRVVLNTIGPVWGANEVWLITAGGALFAAFPQWYATMFSGFYLALVLMLVALIVRGVALEYRSKVAAARWRAWWDGLVVFGSLLLALLWGVALSDLLHGLAINAAGNYVGGFLGLLSPYSLFGGLASLAMFALSGALYLDLRTRGPVQDRVRGILPRLGAVTVVLLGLYLLWTARLPGVLHHWGPAGIGAAVLGWVALLGERGLLVRRPGWAFILQAVAVVLTTAAIFLGLFPRVMVSSLNPAWSLTVTGAASNPYTLGVMTVVALVLVPIALAYQIWAHWLFRAPVQRNSPLEY